MKNKTSKTKTVNKFRIKKGDNVLVIAGKDKGKKGKVEKVIIQKGRLVVTSVNILKKHVRPSQKNKQGGIIEFPSPLNISNVMVFCSKCNKPTRISYKFLKNNKKIRVCNKCGEGI